MCRYSTIKKSVKICIPKAAPDWKIFQIIIPGSGTEEQVVMAFWG